MNTQEIEISRKVVDLVLERNCKVELFNAAEHATDAIMGYTDLSPECGVQERDFKTAYAALRRIREAMAERIHQIDRVLGL